MIQAALGLNISGFAAGAARAGAAMGGMAGPAESAVGKLTSAWSELASGVYIARQVFDVFAGAVGAAVRVIKALGEEMIEAAKAVRNLQSMSEESGLAIDRLVVLRGAFVRVGIGADEASQAITQMSKRLAQGAMFGTGEGVRAFSLLGINMRKMAETGDVLDNFQDIIKALKNVKNDALRTALATEIFGKSGAKMLRIDTAKLGEAEKIFRNQAKIIKESAGFLVYFASAIDAAKEQIVGFWAAFASRVVPPWLGWIEKLENLDLASWGQTIGNFVANVLENFSANKASVYKFFGEIAAALINGIVNLTGAAISGLLTMLTDYSFWAALAGAIVNISLNLMSAAITVVKEAVENIGNLIGSMIISLGAIFGVVAVELGSVVMALGRVIGGFLEGIVFLIQNLSKFLGGLFSWLTDASGMMDDIKGANLIERDITDVGAKSMSDSIERIAQTLKEGGGGSAVTDGVLKSFQSPEGKGSQALPSVAKVVQFVSSLAKVGGGGGFAGGAFNLGATQLNETRRQTNIQQDQLRVLEDIRQNQMNQKDYTENDYSGIGVDFVLP